MSDEKFHYIVKTLSRTKRKDYENYVLNAIWNRLGNLDIKPVSQQFIRNKGKNGYFIDLYFPQLNIGIECDEVHHQSNKESDKIREITITDILFQVGDKEQYQPLHVDVTKPWEEIETRINFCVKQIQKKWEEKKEKGTLKEWTNESIEEFLKDSNTISVGQDFSFNKIVDVLNYLFDKQYKAWRKAMCTLDDSTSAWFPKLATETKRQGHWNNVLTVDGKYIYETSLEEISPSDLKNKVNLETKREAPREFINRHTFAKVINPVTGKGSYKYIGTFKECGSIDKDIRIYKRVSDEINIKSTQ